MKNSPQSDGREFPARAIKVLAFPAFANAKSNPYNALLYRETCKHNITVAEFSLGRLLTGNYDIIHIHWPEKFLNSNYRSKAALGSLLLLIGLAMQKKHGAKIVWTAHNLRPHQIKYPRLYRSFSSRFCRLPDGIISLSNANREILRQQINLPSNAKHTTIYHHLYPPETARKAPQTLAELGVPEMKPYCLFFGRILPYKNVELLINIFKDDPPADLNLVIAGGYESEDYRQKIIRLTQDIPSIILIPRRIDDNELATLLNNCAFGVLPFKSIFNSGSLLQFASYAKPVLTPYSATFAEHASLFKTPPFVLYRDKLSRKLLEEILQKPPHIQTEIPPELTPATAGKHTADFYRELLQNTIGA